MKRLVPYSDSEDSDSEDDLFWIRRKKIRMIESEDEDEEMMPPTVSKVVPKLIAKEEVRKYYKIEESKKRKSVLFRTEASTYHVNFKPFKIDQQPANFVFELFNDIYEQLKEVCGAEPTDKIRLSIYHPSLDLGIFIPYDNASAIRGGLLLDEIQKVMQSNSKLNIHDGNMTFEVTHTRPPVGSGRKQMHDIADSLDLTKKKRSVVQIENADDNDYVPSQSYRGGTMSCR